jgi:hypothetical protein
MPSIPLSVFAFSAIYIGDYDSSAVLTFVPEMRTNGARLLEVSPSTFEQSQGNNVTSGNHVYTVELSFVSDDTLTENIARGLSVNSTNPNGPPGNNQYSLLLLAPDPTLSSNYYFPKIWTLRTIENIYSKTAPTVTNVTFSTEDRNPNTILYYQDTVANLIPIMGSKSPF